MLLSGQGQGSTQRPGLGPKQPPVWLAQTPVLATVPHGWKADVIRFLQDGADIDEFGTDELPNLDCCSPLWIAAKRGHLFRGSDGRTCD